MKTVLEGEGQESRFATRRIGATNIVSAYMQIADQSPNSGRIWAQVGQDVIRARASRSFSPSELIQIVRDSESQSIYTISGRLKRDHSDISRYSRFIGADLALILQAEGLISEPAPAVDQVQYQKLKAFHEEAVAIACVLSQQPVQLQLKSMPDVKAFLEEYQMYLTLKPFFDRNAIPYDIRGGFRIDSRFKDYLFTQRDFAVEPLLRKATFSRWIHGHTNWYGAAEREVDALISWSAAFVCSTPPPEKKKNQACSMRTFLKGIIDREFELTQQDMHLGYDYPFDKAFVSIDGAKITEADDIDTAGTYRLFASMPYCPWTLKLLVREYIEAVSPPKGYRDLVSSMYPQDLAYSPSYKKRWIEGGLAFLENVLLLQPNSFPSWKNLTIERRKMLRQFRNVFRKALKKTKGNKPSS